MTTSEYIVGIKDQNLQAFEIDESLRTMQMQTTEECALMAYKAGNYVLTCAILDRYIWKLRQEDGHDVRDL